MVRARNSTSRHRQPNDAPCRCSTAFINVFSKLANPRSRAVTRSGWRRIRGEHHKPDLAVGNEVDGKMPGRFGLHWARNVAAGVTVIVGQRKWGRFRGTTACDVGTRESPPPRPPLRPRAQAAGNRDGSQMLAVGQARTFAQGTDLLRESVPSASATHPAPSDSNSSINLDRPRAANSSHARRSANHPNRPRRQRRIAPGIGSRGTASPLFASRMACDTGWSAPANEPGAAADDPAPANLVIFLSDNHNRALAGCYGHPKATTPTSTGSPRAACASPTPIRRARCAVRRAPRSRPAASHQTGYFDNAIVYDGRVASWMRRLRDQGHRSPRSASCTSGPRTTTTASAKSCCRCTS